MTPNSPPSARRATQDGTDREPHRTSAEVEGISLRHVARLDLEQTFRAAADLEALASPFSGDVTVSGQSFARLQACIMASLDRAGLVNVVQTHRPGIDDLTAHHEQEASE